VWGIQSLQGSQYQGSQGDLNTTKAENLAVDNMNEWSNVT